MSEKTFKVRITECSVGGLNYESAVGLQLEVEECIEIENSDHYFRVTENNEWLGFYILKSDCTIIPDEQPQEDNPLVYDDNGKLTKKRILGEKEQPQKRRIDLSNHYHIKNHFLSSEVDDLNDYVNEEMRKIIADKDREIEELKKEIESLKNYYGDNSEKLTEKPKLPKKIGTLNFADCDSMVMRNKINEIIDYLKARS